MKFPFGHFGIRPSEPDEGQKHKSGHRWSGDAEFFEFIKDHWVVDFGSDSQFFASLLLLRNRLLIEEIE